MTTRPFKKRKENKAMCVCVCVCGVWGGVEMPMDGLLRQLGQQHTSPLRAGCEARRREIVVILLENDAM